MVGLGNPILGDDGVGWKVAQEFSSIEGHSGRVAVECLSIGGLGLMERMLGYDRVILVDAIETGACPEGNVRTFPLAALDRPGLGHSASAHDVSLDSALKTAEAMGERIPHRVDIVAIEAHRCYDFSEELSPAVAAAVPLAVSSISWLLAE